MKRVVLLVVIATMIIVSCKKNDSENELKPVQTSNYMQLKIGNYWVYEKYTIDSAGIENPVWGDPDSSIITGDTMIDNTMYFTKLSANNGNISFLRDSNGYLVNLAGEVLFSENDFSNIIRIDTIGPGLAYIEYMMHDDDSSINIPLGTYPVIEMRGKVISLDPQYPHGINYTHYFYADGMGQIKTSSYFYSAPHLRMERRLISFGNVNTD
jgi:hypothetical protein